MGGFGVEKPAREEGTETRWMVFGGMKTRGETDPMDHDGWIHGLPLSLLAGPSPRHLDHPLRNQSTAPADNWHNPTFEIRRDKLQRVAKRIQ